MKWGVGKKYCTLEEGLLGAEEQKWLPFGKKGSNIPCHDHMDGRHTLASRGHTPRRESWKKKLLEVRRVRRRGAKERRTCGREMCFSLESHANRVQSLAVWSHGSGEKRDKVNDISFGSGTQM